MLGSTSAEGSDVPTLSQLVVGVAKGFTSLSEWWGVYAGRSPCATEVTARGARSRVEQSPPNNVWRLRLERRIQAAHFEVLNNPGGHTVTESHRPRSRRSPAGNQALLPQDGECDQGLENRKRLVLERIDLCDLRGGNQAPKWDSVNRRRSSLRRPAPPIAGSTGWTRAGDPSVQFSAVIASGIRMIALNQILFIISIVPSGRMLGIRAKISMSSAWSW